MNTFPLSFDPDSSYQAQTLTVSPDGKTQSLRLELRFRTYTGKWYLSIWRMPEGESLLANVPLEASGAYANDLLDLFGYMGLGSMICLPKTAPLSGVNPKLGTLSQYLVLWGDYIA